MDSSPALAGYERLSDAEREAAALRVIASACRVAYDMLPTQSRLRPWLRVRIRLVEEAALARGAGLPLRLV